MGKKRYIGECYFYFYTIHPQNPGLPSDQTVYVIWSIFIYDVPDMHGALDEQ